MKSTSTWEWFLSCERILTARLALACLFFISTLAWPQDAPGRFDVGTSFNTIRMGGTGFSPGVSAQFGPSVDGGFNIFRHFALDGSFTWLPTIRFQGGVTTGLFGIKAGTRTGHFGYFAKVRPGFISFGNVFRDQTNFLPGGQVFNPIVRNARLTEPALDLGGVVEYYPTRRWTLRWDTGDTLLFQERGPTLISVNNGVSTVVFSNPGRTTHQFQFSTGIRYRF